MKRSALAFGRGLLRLGRRCGRDRLQSTVEGVFGVVRFKFTRFVDELLALGARVGLLNFGFCHGLSLHWFVACREVRHG